MSFDNAHVPTVFKLTLHPDGPTHLTSFDEPPQWSALAARVTQLFHLSNSAARNLRASYQDSEGDTITLDTEPELALFYKNVVPGVQPPHFTILTDAAEGGIAAGSGGETDDGDDDAAAEDAVLWHRRPHRRHYYGRGGSHGLPGAPPFPLSLVPPFSYHRHTFRFPLPPPPPLPPFLYHHHSFRSHLPPSPPGPFFRNPDGHHGLGDERLTLQLLFPPPGMPPRARHGTNNEDGGLHTKDRGWQPGHGGFGFLRGGGRGCGCGRAGHPYHCPSFCVAHSSHYGM